MLNKYKTEIIGISAELAISDVFGLPVDEKYRERGDKDVVNITKPVIKKIFEENNLPSPNKIIAYDQNSVDFLLEDGSTLSVKTNQKKLGKVAPQNIGQPTSRTYFEYFKEYFVQEIPSEYEEKAKLFKSFSINNPDIIMKRYWDELFHCDHLIYFYEYLDSNHCLGNQPKYLHLEKQISPFWNKNLFSFTQTLESWNESNTVKYNETSIGEFQVHKNRDCFKFRFIMTGILKLINNI